MAVNALSGLGDSERLLPTFHGGPELPLPALARELTEQRKLDWLDEQVH